MGRYRQPQYLGMLSTAPNYSTPGNWRLPVPLIRLKHRRELPYQVPLQLPDERLPRHQMAMEEQSFLRHRDNQTGP